MTRTLLPALTLWRREMVRFLRQRNRVVAAIAQPALFWALFGAGFAGSFRQGADAGGSAARPTEFLEYFFPGTVVLIVLFTAIFSTISIIEDRQAGFLQSVLVAPVSRAGIVLGKVAGGSSLALLQAAAFLCLAPLAGIHLTVASVAAAFGALALVAFSLTSLGVVVAWPMNSTQGFHAIMMLVLMPMWLLSGAFFPLSGGPAWFGWLMRANPLTYGVALLRHALYEGAPTAAGLPSLPLSFGVTLAFAAAAFAVALFLVGRRTRGDLQ
jgi:ABC-2 type transport system permease protein